MHNSRDSKKLLEEVATMMENFHLYDHPGCKTLSDKQDLLYTKIKLALNTTITENEMSTIDVRKDHPEIRNIIFADGVGGTGKACKLEKSVPTQFNIVSTSGDTLHIKHDDIDNLIKALKLAQQQWGE